MIRTHAFSRLMFVLASALLAACSETPAPPPPFVSAFEALDRALSAEMLNRTGFASRFPNPTPRQVVSFLFAPAGVQALVSDVSPLGEELDPMAGVPVWPRGIILRHSDRSEVSVRQVVLTWDDAMGVVIGEAFDGGPEPVFRKEWKVGPLKATKPADPNDTMVYQWF